MKEIRCLICSALLTVRVSRGRKSNKPFIMFVCPEDGRHFRGFITDQKYVAKVLADKESIFNPVGKTGTGNGSGTTESTENS